MFKIGDRVVLTHATTAFSLQFLNRQGTVENVNEDGSLVYVHFDEMEESSNTYPHQWFFADRFNLASDEAPMSKFTLTLEIPAPPPPPPPPIKLEVSLDLIDYAAFEPQSEKAQAEALFATSGGSINFARERGLSVYCISEKRWIFGEPAAWWVAARK